MVPINNIMTMLQAYDENGTIVMCHLKFVQCDWKICKPIIVIDMNIWRKTVAHDSYAGPW